MTNRNIRDAERRVFIKRATEENLNKVIEDPESLFSDSVEMKEE